MASIEMRFNGRNITSSSQLQRELKRSMEKQIEDNLRKAAGSGARMKKTSDGRCCINSVTGIRSAKY